jgi:hypothetical protein
VPLEVRDLRTADEDVLSCTGFSLFLLDLKLHDVRRVLNDFGNIGVVAGADFTEDTLKDPNDTTDKPIFLSGH